MKHFYYFVPICPYCASRRTGRYVLTPMRKKDEHYIMMKSYKNGEIVKCKRPLPLNNAFCVDCGRDFITDIQVSRFDNDEIDEEIYRRGTDKMYQEYIEKNKIDPDAKAKGGVFSGLFDI